MSPEEIERTVQFLLQQQARFDADLSESQARFDARIDRLAAKTEQVADGLIGLTAIAGRLVDQFAESQKRTDEQFRVLIQTFERHLRDDHGHRPA